MGCVWGRDITLLCITLVSDVWKRKRHRLGITSCCGGCFAKHLLFFFVNSGVPAMGREDYASKNTKTTTTVIERVRSCAAKCVTPQQTNQHNSHIYRNKKCCAVSQNITTLEINSSIFIYTHDLRVVVV